MIILDTNVISELMRDAPDRAVLTWTDAHNTSDLYTTSITQAEILRGITLLPKGRRREALAEKASTMFDSIFRGRILGFGSDAAKTFATIAAEGRHAGKPISLFDAQIAAIARANSSVLATRNVRDFTRCEIEVVDPWRGPPD